MSINSLCYFSQYAQIMSNLYCYLFCKYSEVLSGSEIYQEGSPCPLEGLSAI